ncbi:unnamed protein product, partial [Rotaria sp. Silwood1]
DSSIRTIYRDFAKLFEINRFLSIQEAKMQHGEYQLLQGERRLQHGGSCGTTDYKDIRQYYCQHSSTTLIYVHIATLHTSSAKENINFIQTITNCSYIHLVIFSSYHSDMRMSKLEASEVPFHIHPDQYKIQLEEACDILMEECLKKKDQEQLYIWMEPYPPKQTLNYEQTQQFETILCETNGIATQKGYQIFNTKQIWDNTKEHLIQPGSNHFSPAGNKERLSKEKKI